MISLDKYIELNNAGYPLDIVYILTEIVKGVNPPEKFANNKRLIGLYKMLIRKQLINADNSLTEQGKELLSYLDNKPKPSPHFDTWWSTYPATNVFKHKGRTFTGTQNKRRKKDECRALFNKLVAEGFDPIEIIEATRYQFEMARELSFKGGKNEISFIANSERYLRNKDFAPYIEIYKDKVTVDNDDNVKEVVNTKDLF